MKLKTEGRSEEIMGWFFFLTGWIHRKKRVFFESGRWKTQKKSVLSMSAIENLLNKCAWTLCYILLAEFFLQDLQKHIFQVLRLIFSSHAQGPVS